MKKIINGKMYNTETATEVATYENGLSQNDFGWFSESLYQKRTGEFFLCGEGGGLTKYAYYFDNGSRCAGERIIPFTQAEAKKWVERYCDVDTYIEVFGEPEE